MIEVSRSPSLKGCTYMDTFTSAFFKPRVSLQQRERIEQPLTTANPGPLHLQICSKEAAPIYYHSPPCFTRQIQSSFISVKHYQASARPILTTTIYFGLKF